MTATKAGAYLVLVVVIVATAAITLRTTTPSSPGPGSPEVGFAQDMSVHHAQAVAMAGLVLDRSDDPDITTLARDIQLTQQGQIGQMHAWLALWDQPATTVGPRMAWMTPDGAGMTGRMPGMATPQQLDQLRGLDGDDAGRLFLELMVEHHEAGVDMAEAAVALVEVDVVSNLARAMVDGQQAEIDSMTTMLAQRS